MNLALDHIKSNKNKGSFLILSGSLSVVQKIEHFKPVSKTNFPITNIAKALYNLVSLDKLVWIRGHFGIKGNKSVEGLTKGGFCFRMYGLR